MHHSICDLPKIILSHIITRLNKVDIDNLSLVSSSCYSHIYESKNLWQSLIKSKFGITIIDDPKNYYFEHLKSLYGYTYRGYSVKFKNEALHKIKSQVLSVSCLSDISILKIAFITSDNVLYFIDSISNKEAQAIEVHQNVRKVIVRRDNIFFLDFEQNLYAVDDKLTVKKIMQAVSDIKFNRNNLFILMKNGLIVLYAGWLQALIIDDRNIRFACIKLHAVNPIDTEYLTVVDEIVKNVVDDVILPYLSVIYFRYYDINYTHKMKHFDYNYSTKLLTILTSDKKLFELNPNGEKLKSIMSINSVSLVVDTRSRCYYVVNDQYLYVDTNKYFKFDGQIVKLRYICDTTYILLANGQLYIYGEVDKEMAINGFFTKTRLNEPLLLLEGIVDFDIRSGIQLFIAYDIPTIIG